MLRGIDTYHHISNVTQDQIWVSNVNGLHLVNIKTGYLYHVKDSLCSETGMHAVNSRSELIYIDKDYNIKKVSDVMGVKKENLFLKRKETAWKPLCLYCSPINGDLLVGMYCVDQKTGMITRYTNTGEFKQTISHDNTLYRFPCYITENQNRDVVVSDWGRRSVVVTEHGGRHRFSYTGRELELLPRGICTDALSNILVCDMKRETVQIIDKDGQFLAVLETIGHQLIPICISFDFKNQLIWTGPGFWINDAIYVYRHINRHCPETRHTEYNCPHKLETTVSVSGVDRCYHMSIVSPNSIWISGRDILIFYDAETGKILPSLTDTIRDFMVVGIHTVSSKNELIYISNDYNIIKVSSDMQTKTTFIKKENTYWIPRCIYSSPTSGDILVGMYKPAMKGRVNRYNDSGKHIDTIEHGNGDKELYSCPKIITEKNNGDVVVVCDFNPSGVVVTERGGTFRFTYYKSPRGLPMRTGGICTYELSHIFICDLNTATVHMLDQDGQFLGYLLTRYSPGINNLPFSLCYDANTHRLFVGTSNSNTLTVYRISKNTTL